MLSGSSNFSGTVALMGGNTSVGAGGVVCIRASGPLRCLPGELGSCLRTISDQRPLFSRLLMWKIGEPNREGNSRSVEGSFTNLREESANGGEDGGGPF